MSAGAVVWICPARVEVWGRIVPACWKLGLCTIPGYCNATPCKSWPAVSREVNWSSPVPWPTAVAILRNCVANTDNWAVGVENQSTRATPWTDCSDWAICTTDCSEPVSVIFPCGDSISKYSGDSSPAVKWELMILKPLTEPAFWGNWLIMSAVRERFGNAAYGTSSTIIIGTATQTGCLLTQSPILCQPKRPGFFAVKFLVGQNRYLPKSDINAGTSVSPARRVMATPIASA